ncbi:MAG: hypothetical protein ACE5EK_04980 [Nitrospinales bacterium]
MTSQLAVIKLTLILAFTLTFPSGATSAEISKEEQQKIEDRVHTRLVTELAELGFYPRNKDKPFDNLLYGKFSYGHQDSKVPHTKPAYEKKTISGKDVIVPAGKANLTARSHILSFTRWDLKPQESSSRLIFYSREDIHTKEEGEKKTTAFRLMDGKITENLVYSTRRYYLRHKVYEGLPATMMIVHQRGWITQLAGVLNTGNMKYSPIHKEIKINRPVRISTFLEFKGRPPWHFDVEAWYSDTETLFAKRPWGIVPEVQVLDEAKIDQVMEAVARVLKEELGEKGK